jgi:TolB-like protein/tetratricopeptide (TPR) repeat protein
MGFWRELGRRRVYRMSGFYIVGAWLIIQVADVFFPAWGLPETALRFLIVASILCFPIAVVFSWTFDVTKSGIVKTEPADPGEIFDNSLKRTDYVVLVALLAIGAAIVLGSLQKIVEEVDGVIAVATVEKIANSIAILPFDNLDTNPDTGYFSDGVSDEILHRLSSLNALHVLSRASSFVFRDSDEGPVRISEILGVRYLLHGSVRRDNNLVRVYAYLIDDTGKQLWSETFDRELEGIFAIQSEIANTVASRIEHQIVIPDELPSGRTTTNMEAFDAYLVGRSFLNARTPGYQDKAIAAFEEAIRLDENYAPPYAGLAVAIELNHAADDRAAVRDSAARAAETALELDPELAEAHAVLGLILFDEVSSNGDDAEAKLARVETSLRRALDLDPSLTNAYNWLSITLNRQGRTEESDAVQERGLLVNPLDPVLSVNKAFGLRSQGEHERAERLLLRLIDLPEPPGMAYRGLFDQYTAMGEFDKALHWAKQLARNYVRSDTHIVGPLAATYDRLGLIEDADYWLADLLAHTPQPEQRFWLKASNRRFRGDHGGLQEVIDELDATSGIDVDQLPIRITALYASANILAENFDVGINVFGSVYDLESLSLGNDVRFHGNLEYLHVLAYGYQQVGRDDEANALLARLYEHLNELVIEQKLNSGEVHFLRAQNLGMRGEFDAAADALEAAIEAGWVWYFWVTGSPLWTETIADPRIARRLEDVKVELERQRAIVEQVDAEHDFRAELAALREAAQH